MTISIGDTLPEAKLLRLGADGPEEVSLGALTKGRKVVIFAVPGAFTPTCHSSHMPSFIRSKDALAAKGVEEVICIAVNDPFVMKAWGEATGGAEAGITLLSDSGSAFTRAMGMTFDAPPAGLLARSKRYALLAENGVVKVLHLEESPGACDVSGGESMLDAI
ncbi:peroxiredoxin [Pseudorhodobacter aquimaris]|uniref:peroxiredoxin n=1 Tax=Pseudorhodobacter aquimaris TaxID=687412 RepID=UPI00067CE924|nr:peroxiredoxin [Pseudorhodobacter aquimaris]